MICDTDVTSMDQADINQSLKQLDQGMEEVKAGRGQPFDQAIREIASELGLKLNR